MKMIGSRSLFVAGMALALAACGGGGGGGSEQVTEEVVSDSVTYPPTGPLGKYVGAYSFCKDYTEYKIEFSATQDNDLSADVREMTYENQDCTGPMVVMFGWDAPANVAFLSSGISTVQGGAGLPASLALDKVMLSVQEVRVQLSGPGVKGNCATSAKGTWCYDLTKPQSSEQAGAMYLAGNKLYELQLNNGVYSVSNVYTKR